MRRLPVRLARDEAMWVARVALRHQKLVYVLVADKLLQYKTGRSRIAYIGTTKNGVDRVAESAAFRTEELLGRRGVTAFSVRIVACRARKKVKTWHKLERALLLVFREIYGEVPLCNTQGNRMRWTNECDYFAYSRLEGVIDELR